MKAMSIALTAALVGLGAAFAQAVPGEPFLQRASATDLRISDLMGATVYVTDAPVAATVVDGAMDDWTTVGAVDDVVTALDGEIRGVLIDVGGFLGIGARTVMIDMAAVRLVHERDTGAIHVVVATTREALENAPEFDADTIGSQARSDFAGRVGLPEAPVAGFDPVETSALTVDELTGAPVYDRFGDRVSGIGDVVLSQGGEVEAVLIDVGGFLGLFTRTVVVDIERLEIRRDLERGAVRVYLTMTQAELEALPEHGW